MKGRPVPPRNLPADAIMIDDRRIQACLRACAHIATEALETGLVHDVFGLEGQLVMVVALAARVAAQGKNPALYLDFARLVKKAAPVNARVAASGYDEAQNRAWEQRHGRSLGGEADIVLMPLGKRKEQAA